MKSLLIRLAARKIQPIPLREAQRCRGSSPYSRATLPPSPVMKNTATPAAHRPLLQRQNRLQAECHPQSPSTKSSGVVSECRTRHSPCTASSKDSSRRYRAQWPVCLKPSCRAIAAFKPPSVFAAASANTPRTHPSHATQQAATCRPQDSASARKSRSRQRTPAPPRTMRRPAPDHIVKSRILGFDLPFLLGLIEPWSERDARHPPR